MDYANSIIMSNNKIDKKCDLQIMSISTFAKREEKGNLDFLKDFDIIIIDEAHNCVQESYLNLFSFLGDKKYIGFSATFFRVGNKYHTFWDECINKISSRNLIDKNQLNEYNLFLPSSINTEDMRVSNGDFNLQDLDKKINNNTIVGNLINHYKKIGKNRVGIVFCVNINHSKKVQKEFEKEGIKAVHIDANTPLTVRNQYIKELKEYSILNKPYIITNILTMAIAVDIPEIEVLIHARPTMSEILYIQSIGRVMRVTPHKGRKTIIIDMTRNVYMHGLPCIRREAELIRPKKKKDKRAERNIAMVVCKVCFVFNPAHRDKCLNCNSKLIKNQDEKVKIEDGELVEYKPNEVLDFCKEKKQNLINQRSYIVKKFKNAKPLEKNELNNKVLDIAYKKYGKAMYHVASEKWKQSHKEKTIKRSIKNEINKNGK